MNKEKTILEMTTEEKIHYIVGKIVEEENRDMREHWAKELKGYTDRLFHPEAF